MRRRSSRRAQNGVSVRRAARHSGVAVGTPALSGSVRRARNEVARRAQRVTGGLWTRGERKP